MSLELGLKKIVQERKIELRVSNHTVESYPSDSCYFCSKGNFMYVVIEFEGEEFYLCGKCLLEFTKKFENLGFEYWVAHCSKEDRALIFRWKEKGSRQDKKI